MRAHAPLQVLLRAARARGGGFAGPVMVSTQLMESMIKNAVPTRAEVSDAMHGLTNHHWPSLVMTDQQWWLGQRRDVRSH